MKRARLFDQFNALIKTGRRSMPIRASLPASSGAMLINGLTTVTIDRGLLSGISKDQPVVTAEGLVGRVILATPIASQVLLVTDERHGAGRGR